MRLSMRAALVMLGAVAVGCGKAPSGMPRDAGGHAAGQPVDPLPSTTGTPNAGGSTGSPTPPPSGGAPALLPGAAALRYLSYVDARSWAGPVVDQAGRVFVARGVRVGATPQEVDVVVQELGDDAAVLNQRRFGGSGYEEVGGISIAPDGDLVIAGSTGSRDFPSTTPLSATPTDYLDAFVARLSPDLSTIRLATAYDEGGAVPYHATTGWSAAADGSGNVFLSGSHEGGFGGHSNTQDTFVLRFAPDGSAAPVAGGYFANGIGGWAVDPAGRVYLARSRATVLGPIEDEASAFELFLEVRNEALTTTSFFRVSGGPEDSAGPLVLSGGLVYVAGTTTSTNFPVTSGAAQAASAGGRDGFIAAVRADTGEVVWATYFGGSGDETIFDLAVAPDGRVAVVGTTGSPDLPLVHALQGPSASISSVYYAFNGDAFVVVLSPDGSHLELSTYIAGSDNDKATSIAWLGDSVVVAGSTQSADLPVTNAAGPGLVDGWAIFLARIDVPR